MLKPTISMLNPMNFIDSTTISLTERKTSSFMFTRLSNVNRKWEGMWEALHVLILIRMKMYSQGLLLHFKWEISIFPGIFPPLIANKIIAPIFHSKGDILIDIYCYNLQFFKRSVRHMIFDLEIRNWEVWKLNFSV